MWTLPAKRPKANREHRVPLCSRAMEIDAFLFRDPTRPVTVALLGHLDLLAVARDSMAFAAAYTKPRSPVFENKCRYCDPTTISIRPAIGWPIAHPPENLSKEPTE